MNLLATIHNLRYAELAAMTWDKNRVLYAEKHGYAHCAKTDDFYGLAVGFEKIQFLSDLLEAHSDIDWILWTGTDSLITNFNIKIEQRISDTHDVIMAGDFNFAINADVMLVKNTHRSKQWLNAIMDRYDTYASHQYAEQQCMLDIMPDWHDVVKLVPQRDINSYDYSLYAGPPWNYQDHRDVAGNDGQWQPGDWIIQWPGTQMHERIELVKKYSSLIIEGD